MDSIAYILVADASKARIYSAQKARLFNANNGKDLKLISEHQHDASRKKDIDLVSDRQGQFGSGTFVEATDPKRHEEDRFAQELTKIISQAHNKKNFHELILIAPPVFMGMINKHLGREVDKLVNIRIEKDYTSDSEKELVTHLQGYL